MVGPKVGHSGAGARLVLCSGGGSYDERIARGAENQFRGRDGGKSTMQLKLRSLSERHPVLGPSVTGAVTVALCLSLFGAGIGPVPLVEVGAGAVVFSAIVSGAILLGRRRGLLVLWVLMPMLWMNVLYVALQNGDWNWIRAARELPEPFVAWSMLALPLCAATAVFLYARHANPYPQAFVFAGTVAWLVLLTFSSHLSRYAPDVGPNPRDHSIARWIVVTLSLVPFVVSWTSIRLTGRVLRDEPPVGVV